MFSFGTLAAFMLAVLALFLIPGPAVLLVLARSIAGGRKVGLATGLGIALGDVLHTVMSALGLSAVLMTSALAFEVVKYLGAAYLLYLGLRALVAKTNGISMPKVSATDARRAFRQAILAELLNPKTALFFLAFLPQFVRPERGSIVLQLLLLGLIFVAMSIAYASVIALGAGSVGRWLTRHPRLGRWQGKLIGGVYLGLGLRLAFETRP